MTLFRLKPSFVDAVTWTGKNEDEIKNLIGDNAIFEYRSVSGDSISRVKPLSGQYTISLTVISKDKKVKVEINDVIYKNVNTGNILVLNNASFHELYTLA